MRSLAVYLKNYKKETILAPFFKFLEVVFDLMVPVVIAHMIDVGIAENKPRCHYPELFDSDPYGRRRSDCQYHRPKFLQQKQSTDLPQSFWVNLCLIIQDFPILSLTVLEPPP